MIWFLIDTKSNILLKNTIKKLAGQCVYTKITKILSLKSVQYTQLFNPLKSYIDLKWTIESRLNP